MSGRRQRSPFEGIAAPFADVPAPVGLGVASALGVFGWGLTLYHGTSLGAVLVATMMPWLIWFLAVMIVGYSMVGVIRRFFDRKRFDTTDDLRRLDPYQFERYIAEYYRRRGWLVTNRGGRAPDGGVDVVIENKTEKLLVQCKHWSAWKVGARPVRELAGLIRAERATGAILVTSGQFTKEAIDFARSANIELVDGPQLAKMIAEVRTPQPGASVTVDARSMSPQCPECGAELVLRTARRGPHSGDRFWGCSSFPTCRHTEPLVREAAPWSLPSSRR